MKILFLVLINFVSILTSCGKKEDENAARFMREQKIVLGAYYDYNFTSTLHLDALTTLPRIVDLKKFMTPVRHQWDRGNCSFFSTMAIAESAIKKTMQVDTNLSEEFLIHKLTWEKKLHVEGSTTGDNLKTLLRVGFLKEEDWPYQPSWFKKDMECQNYNVTDILAPIECFAHNAPTSATLKKVILADKFEILELPESTNELIKFLAYEQRPVVIAITIPNKGWPLNGEIEFTENDRDYCNKSENCGGHEITLTGYDLDKKVFFFKNSWGETWGKAGYGTISLSSVDRFSSPKKYSLALKETIPFENKERIQKIKLKRFLVKSKYKEDRSQSIKAYVKLEETSGQTIYASSYLTRQIKNYEDAPSETNTEIIYNLTKDSISTNNIISRFSYENQSIFNELDWSEKNPLDLSISSQKLSEATTLNIINTEAEKLFLRTSIYVFSDSGWMTLGRIYHKMNSDQ